VVIVEAVQAKPWRGMDGAACRLDNDLPLPGLLVGPQRSGGVCVSAIVGQVW
jgi:hypothetical protein